MQIFLRAFLAIYLAHLLTDFIFQTNRMVEQKRRRHFSAYVLHGSLHYLCAITITGLVLRGALFSWPTHLVLGALAVIHALIDLANMQLAARYPLCDGAWSYVTDQFLHLVTVGVAA
jgi:hypothetical protein